MPRWTEEEGESHEIADRPSTVVLVGLAIVVVVVGIAFLQ